MSFQVNSRTGWLACRRRPQSLRVANDAIQLIVQDQIRGHVPFANVEMIRNLWNKDDRPYWDRTIALTQLAGVLFTLCIGIAETWWFWLFPDSTRENSRGIVVVVKDIADPNTWWIPADFRLPRKQIHIKGRWEMTFPQIVERLREGEMGYLQDRGQAAMPAQDEKLFEFGP